MNSTERDGCCRPGLPLPLVFAAVIRVTALLVVWPGWLRTAQAQSWVSEEGGRVRHIVVTLNKSRTLRFDSRSPALLSERPTSWTRCRCRIGCSTFRQEGRHHQRVSV
jgi:hypothetical protein